MLTTTLMTDRMILYTRFLPTLRQYAEVEVWAKSYSSARHVWQGLDATVCGFPETFPYREFPYNYLRRLNEFVWDFRLRIPSRLSIYRHTRNYGLPLKLVREFGRVLALLRLERTLERNLERLLCTYPRSPEARQRLERQRPDLILTTSPFWFYEPAVVAAAKRLKIPVMALIPSWDNLSTKNRMVFSYDGFIVWNEQLKKELLEFYPVSRSVPVYVAGAPQFDLFLREDLYVSREDFCARYGLEPSLPIVLYALGSPNFIKEHPGALEMAKRVVAGELGEAQLLVRPHPAHSNIEMTQMFAPYAPRVVLQQSAAVKMKVNDRTQDLSQVVDWINTFRHSDVVVNLSSTVAIDGAIFDKPIVNIDFDPEPGQPNQQLIKDLNHLWNHFSPVAQSGGMWLAGDMDQVVEAVRGYLKDPSLHREKRRWIVEYVCGYIDGRSGERMARAVIDLLTMARRDGRAG